MRWGSLTVAAVIGAVNKLESGVIPLLASPQGGEAASSKQFREATEADAAGVVFLFVSIGKPPRPRDQRMLRDICRGRNGDRSPPPARIRTYRFPIFGSCLGSAAKAGRRVGMTDDSGRNPAIDVTRHAVPPEIAPLTTPTQPFLP